MNTGHFEVRHGEYDNWKSIEKWRLESRISDKSAIYEMVANPGKEYRLTNGAWYRWVTDVETWEKETANA